MPLGLVALATVVFALHANRPTASRKRIDLLGMGMIPMTVGLLVAAIVTGRLISATGRYKMYPIIGTALVAVGLVLLSQIDQDTVYWYLALSLLGLGLGVGSAMQNLTLKVQNSVPGEVLGTATSAQNYVRQIGASVGIAVFGSVFITRLTTELSGTTINGVRGGNVSSLTPELLAELPEQVQEMIASAFSTAMPPLFLYAVPVVLIGLVFALFIEARTLSADPTPVHANEPASDTAASSGPSIINISATPQESAPRRSA